MYPGKSAFQVRASHVTRLALCIATASIPFACSKPVSVSNQTASKTQPTLHLDHDATPHSHAAPHGGQIQEVGDRHFELAYDDSDGRFTLYLLGDHESKPAPVAVAEITLQVRVADQFKSAKLVANPLDGETNGMSSRFTGTGEDLAKLGDFDAVARVPVDGEPQRVAFQFVAGKPIGLLATGSPDGFACPMSCEAAKVYAAPGKCPVCKMKLEEHKAGTTAHADHKPKYGGQFFMAPDNWHHLEGTLVSERELRIYLYDNFTKPLDSAGFAGQVRIQSVDEQDEEIGTSVTVPVRPVTKQPYLVAEIPEGTKLPIHTEARLTFPKAPTSYLFNFDFRGRQHQP